jgi:cytochrome bd ubiquinol oxidase subunit II
LSLDAGTLPVVWFALLGVLLAGYAVLDGFDLGVGMVHLFVARSDEERRMCLQSIGPLWDGNEVWLVTFGGALFAAFPAAYAAIFSGFYGAFMALLFALIARAVAIELRGKRASRAWRRFFDAVFALASTAAALLFGVAVGNAIAGVPIDAHGDYAGSLAGQLRPYPLLVGSLTVTLFAMHGAIYLHLKTEGPLRERVQRWMWRAFGLFLVAYMLTSGATLVALPHVIANLQRWPVLWAVPVLAVLAIANVPREIFRGRSGRAFASSCATIAALVFLLGAALFPNLLRASNGPANSLTVWDAASSAKTLRIMLGIAGLGMPAVLAYTGLVYWTFRGRVRPDEQAY